MSLRVELVGPQGADIGADMIALSGPQKDKLMLGVIRRHTTLIRRAAAKTLISRGIARTIWGVPFGPQQPGKRNLGIAGAMAAIAGRVRLKDHVFTSTIIVRGVASMMEEGGSRTTAHTIFPKNRMALHFMGSQGETFVGIPPRKAGEKSRHYSKRLRQDERGVHHPGGPVPKQEHTKPEIDKQSPALMRDMESVIDGLIAAVRGKR